ncbi:lipopolysaccharide biosynthesis protein [Rubellicoccus peritrichatus]|uniref:Lipopolysaccharide biosynthesis protein n=1 Tax=Rubellicoccus peritrichatus TaxID=3080537 RepID=A0AAQ3QUZ1_9BACT|nr:lipopolysaccharide biosynthesis protein [Puniceicoccus sp. CR14]WOO42916.1 lipopolysaccharide biosynthesis protein [Puniceicoccus sp. CR14]
MSNVAKISRKKTTLWTLFFAYTTIAYAVISGIVLVPLYLRYISVDLYGAWLASGNLLAWLTVIDPGISTVVLQRVSISYGEKNYSALMSYVNAGVLVTSAIVVIVVIGGWIVSIYLPEIIGFKEAEEGQILKDAFFLAVLGSALMLLSFSVGAANRGILGSIGPGLVVLFGNIGTLVLTLILLFWDFGLFAIAWGLFFRGASYLLGHVFYFLLRAYRDKMKVSISFERVTELFHLMAFTSFGKVGYVLTNNMDALLIARFLGPESVPVFVLTRRSYSVAEMILNRTGNAIAPSLSHLKGEGDRVKVQGILYRLLRLNIWLLGLAFAGFFAFNDDFVRLWVGERFFAGSFVSYLLCIWMVASVILTLMQTLCIALGDIKRNAAIQFVQAIIIFPLLVSGIYFFGFIGAVMAPLIGLIAISSWYYPKSLSHHGSMTRGAWKRLKVEAIRSILLGVTVGALFLGLKPGDWLSFILCAAALVLLYCISLFLVSHSARDVFKHFAQRINLLPS